MSHGYLPPPPYALRPVRLTTSNSQWKPPIELRQVSFPNPEETSMAIEPYVSQAMYSPFGGYGVTHMPRLRSKDATLMGSASRHPGMVSPTVAGPMMRGHLAAGSMPAWSDDGVSWDDEWDDDDDLFEDMDAMSADILGLTEEDYETISAARTFLHGHAFGAEELTKAQQRRAKRKLMVSSLFKPVEPGQPTRAEKAVAAATQLTKNLQQMQHNIDQTLFPKKAAQRAAARDARQSVQRQQARQEWVEDRVDQARSAAHQVAHSASTLTPLQVVGLGLMAGIGGALIVRGMK